LKQVIQFVRGGVLREWERLSGAGWELSGMPTEGACVEETSLERRRRGQMPSHGGRTIETTGAWEERGQGLYIMPCIT
jgi:hypothetical protein